MSFFNQISGNPVLLLEAILIGTVFIIQIFFYFWIRKDIKILEDTFSKKLNLLSTDVTKPNDESNGQLAFGIAKKLTSSSKNPIHLRIKNSINKYLLYNSGATINYSIIKDIIDREIDGKNEEIVQSIPIPLYLGLSATIIGIIFGLFAMPNLTETAVDSGSGSLEAMDALGPLIEGVKIAMVATLSGLLWTIVLSSVVYKKGIKVISEQKNEQLNYLQENLLPELFKEEDAGVIGLKTSIDNFSRLSTDIVAELKEATQNSKDNIISQQETLDRIEKLNVTKISKVNLELFDRLEKNMDAFHKFSEFLENMETISSNLYSFSLKTKQIDDIASEIKASVTESRELTKFLTAHLEKIENMGDGALYSVDMAEKGFKEAIEALEKSAGKNIEEIGNVSDQIEQKFNTIYDTLFKKLDEVTKLYIDELSSVYSDAVPRFESLDYLSHLEHIKEHLEQATNGTDTSIPEINEKLNQLEVANKRLAQMNQLLNSVEKNTKNLKSLKVTEKSSLSKALRDFMEWIKSLFGR